jgi:hypothetical protein
MKKIFLIIIFQLFIFHFQTKAQLYPTFGAEIPVSINGLTFDAMEPFLSNDENTLFFNSLNAGGNTNLYYAERVDDSTFNYIGLLNGTVDTSANHLDAVASMDSTNRFYWVSLRNYPTIFENLHSGLFNGTTISNVKRVYGNFNIPTLGWIIMDAAVSYQSVQLYYCNAFFDFVNNSCGAGIPCSASIGVAQKINDSTFNKLANTDAIFALINDTNYLVYAPQVSHDGLELYFTRLLKNTFNTQVCVAVRNNINDSFSSPQVIHQNNGFAPEGPTINANKTKLYYHQKDGIGLHKIYLRYRTNTVGSFETTMENNILIYPNPVSNNLNLIIDEKVSMLTVDLFSLDGRKLYTLNNQNSIDFTEFNKGVYILKICTNNRNYVERIVKE